MNIGCLSIKELQLLRISYKVKDLATLLETVESEVYFIFKELEILSPPELVRSIPTDQLMLEICYNGHKRVAEKYFVSEAFIKSLFKFEEQYDNVFLQSQVERFGSTSVVKKMYSYKGTLLPPSPQNRFRGLGNMNSKVGSDAEKEVIKWLSEYCETCEDVNEYNPTADHDIFTDLYGRINVKAMTGGPSWRFPTAKNCEYVCCVGLKNRQIMFAALVPPTELPGTFVFDDILQYTNKVFQQRLFL